MTRTLYATAALAIGSLLLFSESWAAPAYEVDFTDYKSGSVVAWLRAKGFEPERDAKSDSKIALSAGATGLRIDVLRRARGFLINRAVSADYSRIEIEWGVTHYPEGASYENGVNNEAVMVQVFLGKDVASGSMFAPDIPYFVGLFLCEGDRIGHPYVGHYYTQSGRYVCLDSPPKGETVVSKFDLQGGPRAALGPDGDRDVSGFVISVDTTASGSGRSSAFIRKICFVP